MLHDAAIIHDLATFSLDPTILSLDLAHQRVHSQSFVEGEIGWIWIGVSLRLEGEIPFMM